MTFDDNGLFRHKDLRDLRDLDEEDPSKSKPPSTASTTSSSTARRLHGQRRGSRHGTMDIIKYAGGSPANFLTSAAEHPRNK